MLKFSISMSSYVINKEVWKNHMFTLTTTQLCQAGKQLLALGTLLQ